MDVGREIERLLATGKYPDPRLGSFGKALFHEKKIRELALPRYGIVSDNKDPMKLGRVRVACDMIAPGAVTPWIPVIRPWASKESGWWSLPDIGTQVLLGFIGNSTNQPVCLGCVYDLKHLPPKHSTENPSDSIVFQTKNHRLEIIDEDGKEAIIFSSAKGKIRLVLSNEKGVEFINEIGDITIEARHITLEGKKGVFIEAEKAVEMASEGTFSVKAKKHIGISCDKEVKMKAQCIKLQGSQGITTEGKQLAAEGNQVMGFDVHNMEVPSGKGTTTVPLPHPYIGKLVDKLSSDVKINGHNAATKESKSKHDSPVHMQLPGTVKFTNNPNKEGKVTGGTGKKVKINGKEAAVIGSTVTTCNDVGARDNSTILAPGVHMPMPVIINPKNMAEYKLEREKQETRKPEFTTLKWNKTNVKEGEELELSAQVKDIDDGNMVTFQIWKDGQDPNRHSAYWTLPATVEGGVAKVKWYYRLPKSAETIPEQDPAFFFSAHSAWCSFKKSGNTTIELKRPELSNPVWKDKDGNDTDKGLAGETLKLCVDCNADMEEGAGVIFKIFDKERNKVGELGGENQGGKAETLWRAKDTRKDDDKSELTYTFTASAKRAKEVKSGSAAVKNPQIVEMKWKPETVFQGETVTLILITFEVSCFSPDVNIQLWENEKYHPAAFVLEQDATINQDTMELSFELPEAIEDVSVYDGKPEYALYAKIICESFRIKPCKEPYFIVGVNNAAE